MFVEKIINKIFKGLGLLGKTRDKFIDSFKVRKIKFETLKGHTFIDSFNRDSVLVDLGANIGEFSNLLFKRHLFARAILIEANPLLIKKLRNNFHGRKGVRVINAVAFSEKKSKKIFYLSKSTESSSVYKKFRYRAGEDKTLKQVLINNISLRQIFERFNFKKIDLLKIDIEGAEWSFLQDFSIEDYHKIDQISVEFHDFINPFQRYKSERIIKRLKNFGYSFVHKGSDFLNGTPYKDCLFYKERLLRG